MDKTRRKDNNVVIEIKKEEQETIFCTKRTRKHGRKQEEAAVHYIPHGDIHL